MVINIHNGNEDASGAPESSGGGCGTGGCSSGTCGNGLEKIYPTAVVRYGYMRTVGEFRYPNRGMQFGCGASVIIETNRGIELGEMVSVSCDGCDKCVSRDQIKSYVNESGPDYYHFGNGKILRLASESDVSDWEHIRAESLRKKQFCQQRANEAGLAMKVLECEHLFGGERIIFYFMSEGRVDFRHLVRGLADEFQTRIEMRQVGARDEARLLADYETCGRECCCKNFLKTLRPISMKMAKMQKATLDPAKVSGRCGRLKCCLRYEHTTYEELNKKLPSVGKKVFSEQGNGVVVARQILTQLLQIQTADGGRITLTVEDLLDEAEAQRRLEARQSEARQKAQAPRAEAPKTGERSERPEGRSGAPKNRRGRRRGRSGQRGDGESGMNGGGDPSSEASPAPNAPTSAEGKGPERAANGERPVNEQGGDESTGKRRRRRRGRRSSRNRRTDGAPQGGSEGGGGAESGPPPGDS